MKETVRTASVLEIYNEALKIDENNQTILFTLANAYHAMGDAQKTIEIVEKILKINPKHVSAHKLLSSIIDYSNDLANLNQMEDIISEKNLTNGQITDLSFALGKAYEDLKKFEKSFLCLERANKLRKNSTNYNIIKEINFFENIKKTFNNIGFNDEKRLFNKIKPIFICGMPRSGTTLVEQIIASHQDVFGAGELVYIQRLIKKFFIQTISFTKDYIFLSVSLTS